MRTFVALAFAATCFGCGEAQPTTPPAQSRDVWVVDGTHRYARADGYLVVMLDSGIRVLRDGKQVAFYSGTHEAVLETSMTPAEEAEWEALGRSRRADK